jgi:transcriptional regulator with XRE-family HTH domain
VSDLGANLEFGPRLKAHRERRGITLEAIASSTKVKSSLLAELERNKVSNWPEGIYRRARVRDYAVAIGLPPEPVLEEFCRTFPDPSELHPAGAVSAASPLRLTLADTPRWRLRMTRSRLESALTAFALVLMCGGVLTLLSNIDFLTASGRVALIFYPLASIFGALSVAHLIRSLQRPFRRPQQRPSSPEAAAPSEAKSGHRRTDSDIGVVEPPHWASRDLWSQPSAAPRECRPPSVS